ncbi:caspase family protein [Sinorhizobium meliloti]|nr:caspase family protein [Sinorhizobium meliloti]
MMIALVPAYSVLARTNYAVLVGVTEYPNFPKDNWLEGPRNDALLVREYLTRQSPVRFESANISLLMDEMEGAKEPTLISILSTLDGMADRVRDGDFVYVHFSGHGFQQPAADPSTETDGLDRANGDQSPFSTYSWTDAHILEGFITNCQGDDSSVVPWAPAVLILDQDVGASLE